MGTKYLAICQTFRKSAPRGITFIEFLGCMTALIGGIAIGAMYLGIDLQASCLQILVRARVIQGPTTATIQTDQVALQAAHPAPGQETGQLVFAQPEMEPRDADAEASESQADSSLAEDDADAGDQATVVQMAADLGDAVRSALEARLVELQADEVPAEERAVLTEAYWSQLCALIDADVERRSFENAQEGLFGVLKYREQGHAAMARSLDELSLQGVDPHVASYVLRLQQWHADGAKLYQLASRLLTDVPTAPLSGPIAKGWQNAATQHRMEEKLLREKRRSIVAYLEHARAGAPSTPAENE